MNIPSREMRMSFMSKWEVNKRLLSKQIRLVNTLTKWWKNLSNRYSNGSASNGLSEFLPSSICVALPSRGQNWHCRSFQFTGSLESLKQNDESSFTVGKTKWNAIMRKHFTRNVQI